jgi:predicted nucleotidyltransferase component of viral defense system
MKERAAGIEQSVLARLKTAAVSRGQSFELMLTYYGMERFLYRLSQTEECKDFVLKGGLLMMTWPHRVLRATRDIDLRVYLPSDQEAIRILFQRVSSIEVPFDGIRFNPDTVELEAISEQANYEGIRIRLWGFIAKARIRIQIDLGFSDPISPRPKLVNYPTILDMPEPRIRVYPIESFISEKMEAIVQLGEINSRMKDFYDLYLAANQQGLNGSRLVEAIRKTFNSRKTEIPGDVPAGLTEEFARRQETQWTAFLRRIGAAGEEKHALVDICARLREFLMPVMVAAKKDDPFQYSWMPELGWQDAVKVQ